MGKEQCSSYCIFRSSREGYSRSLKKKKNFFFFAQGRNWTGGVGVATSFWCRDLAEGRTEFGWA